MTAYLKRLVSSLAAYQLADVVSKLIAVLLLPVYTRYIAPAGYGVVELLANGVILISIVVRFGMIEAFLRFYFTDEDAERRDALVRRAAGFLLLATTLTAVVLVVFAAPLSRIVLSHRDTATFCRRARAVVVHQPRARLRPAPRRRAPAYLRDRIAQQRADDDRRLGGARGRLRRRRAWPVARQLRRLHGGPAGPVVDHASSPRAPSGRAERMAVLLRFGLPTVPAEASVYALSIVDRYYIYHDRSQALAGLYSIAIKLAGAVAFIVRAFQYAWPPLAYSITDDAQAARLYGLVTTYYLLVSGWVVAGLALLGRWVLRLLTAHQYFGAYRALPWVALGWALYGLWVVFLVIAGRAKVTTRNFPASLAGLAANVVLIVVLVPRLGIAGAGIALSGAYVVMLGVMYALTRNVFRVAFEWLRLTRLVVVMGGLAAAGDVVLPTHGVVGLLTRAAVFAAIPPALLATGFAHRAELAQLRSLIARGRRVFPPAAGGAS